MASLVARATLCLIFGFFIYETINEFNKLSGLSLNPYLAIAPAVLVFVSHEVVIKKFGATEKTVPFRNLRRQQLIKFSTSSPGFL
jgi:hypothetical protein